MVFGIVDYSSMVKQRTFGPDSMDPTEDSSSAFIDASLPPSPSRPSHPPEQAASGTERVHPIPENCRPGAQNWNENRQQWMHAAVRYVKRKGLKVTRVKLL